MRRSTLALVESATQLLNVAEWAHVTGEADDMTVVVLAPNDVHTLRQVNRVGELTAGIGLDVRMAGVRTPTPAGLARAVRVLSAVARADRLIVGDPFSQLIQSLLPLAVAPDVVVVDDGTATWEFADCVNAGRPLVRWRAAADRSRRRAARATAFYSPSPSRRLTVFSCLSDAGPLAATVLANRYEWTRSWARPEVTDDELDVLGVSLVDTGVVARAPYVAAIGQLAHDHGAVRYVAHRRETAGLLAEIAGLPGVRVVRGDLPVELGLRRGPVARRIRTFPSTAAHTLPVVLSDVGVRIDVQAVRPEWFTPTTTAHARQFVARIADVAPRQRPRPQLEIA